jgi:hypothetical protein
MILIDAVYINTGGGKVLLRELLTELRHAPGVALLLDTRLEGLDTSGYETFVVGPGERSRLTFYKDKRHELERVLCFGNVPPPCRLNASVAVYFHNILLCAPVAAIGLRKRWVSAMKMAYIGFMSRNADFFLVQSPMVKHALACRLPGAATILQLPFYPVRPIHSAGVPNLSGRWDRYAYVSNGYAHKNHGILLEAWQNLARHGVYPELHLTVTDDYPKLRSKIETARGYGCQIVNHGHTDVSKLYRDCGYQIYPSLAESFGLGLVEAAENGCAILASDLPYVQQVVRPHATFDPCSSAEIEALVIATYGKPAIPSEVLVNSQLPRLGAWIKSGQSLK